ncbi:aberrant root formation protein 4 isoform X2 [Asparagus officinalis]|uniref:aberrant root formation protein 4 isoform X2 n=1 Tax=Asparagus officinalis TaxID=4686 RepID=UPI00098E72C7|nr:aberrant root formation protein 4 isoform X2 [Asparagus officinalis]
MSASRLKESLQACSKSFETGDIAESDEAVAGAVSLLDSIAEAPPPDAEDVLIEIDRFLSSQQSNRMAVDALSLEFPKVVIRFASLSDKCEEIAGDVIKNLVGICNPRDMLSILCEALDSHINVSRAPIYYVLLLNELSKVFRRIQRRQIEQLKVALPVILKVIYEVSSDTDEGDRNSLDELFGAAYSIGTSIQKICEELEERMKQELCAILGLYALQNIALVSRSRRAHRASSLCLHVVEFSRFLRFCGLSYSGLITGSDFNSIAGKISKMDGDDVMACFSFALDGASLAVIWGLISDKVADAAGQQVDATLNIIRNHSNKRWLAVCMLKSIFSSIHYPWEIKSHSIDLLLSIMGGVDPKEAYDKSIDFASFMPGIFAVLKGIERTVIGAPDASSRKRTFGALRKVVSSLPCSERFDVLKALITNSVSPSMMALLVDIVKEEIHVESHQKITPGADETTKGQIYKESCPFWTPHVLDVVELILKPPQGGPPPLPEHSEPGKQTKRVCLKRIHSEKPTQSGYSLFGH